MTDSSWDNQGSSPQKAGWPTWAKVLLGCGLGCVGLFILTVGGCVGAGVWISRNPEGFERFVKSKVQDLAREDWNRLRRTVELLQTPEGTRDLFEANPGLKAHHPDLQAFEAQVAIWRPLLKPVPEAIPDLDSKAFHYQSNPGRTRIGWRQPDGTRVRIEIRQQTLARIQVIPPKGNVTSRTPSEPEPEAP